MTMAPPEEDGDLAEPESAMQDPKVIIFLDQWQRAKDEARRRTEVKRSEDEARRRKEIKRSAAMEVDPEAEANSAP